MRRRCGWRRTSGGSVSDRASRIPVRRDVRPAVGVCDFDPFLLLLLVLLRSLFSGAGGHFDPLVVDGLGW